MKVGDKVVCIKKDKWEQISGAKSSIGNPKYNEIVIIDGLCPDGTPFVSLRGYGYVFYNKRHFKPLITDHNFTNKLTKELSNIKLYEERLEEIKPEKLEVKLK